MSGSSIDPNTDGTVTSSEDQATAELVQECNADGSAGVELAVVVLAVGVIVGIVINLRKHGR